MISAKVIADSINSEDDRLTTMVLEYPRFIHGELMTHRVFSRNAASSRAIPTAKLIEQVRNNPAMPIEWGSNQPGMQAGPVLGRLDREEAIARWRWAAGAAVAQAELLFEIGVHKQIVNRILEPFMWMKTIVSSTEWTNFFNQRISSDSQPEMRQLALTMELELMDSTPRELGYREWHLPYVGEPFQSLEIAKQVAVARCARVSYLQHDGTRDVSKDLELYGRLKAGGHWSPFEHVATPGIRRPYGNFKGWTQLRHSPEHQ